MYKSIILACSILLFACTPQNQPSATHNQVVEKQNSTPSQHHLLSQVKWRFLHGKNIKNPILQKLNHQTTLDFSPLAYDKNNLLLADIQLDPNYHLYSVSYTSGCSYTSSGLYLAKDKNEISKSIYAFSADMVNCGETTQIETALSEFLASQIAYQIENQQLILIDKQGQTLVFKAVQNAV